MRPSRLALAALLAAAVGLAPGCRADEAEPRSAPDFETVEAGRLVVCSDIPYAPFEMEEEDGSGYTGFDIELMRAVAAELGLELSVAVVAFEELVSGRAFDAGACDVAASAIAVSDEREEVVDFTASYYDAGPSLLVRTGTGPRSLEEVAVLGVQADTAGQMYAAENFDGRVVEFPGPDELVAALGAGAIDGILQDLPVNAERARADDTVTVVDTYPTGERFAFAVAEGNAALRGAIDGALGQLRAGATYDELFQRFFRIAAS